MPNRIDPKDLTPALAAMLLRDLKVKPEEHSPFIDALRKRAAEEETIVS